MVLSLTSTIVDESTRRMPLRFMANNASPLAVAMSRRQDLSIAVPNESALRHCALASRAPIVPATRQAANHLWNRFIRASIGERLVEFMPRRRSSDSFVGDVLNSLH
jgi:hypothetical protein